MKLEVQQATSADIDSAKQYYTPETGNLCAAAAGAFWPEPEDDTAKAKLRAEWSCQQQKEVLENDPSTEFIKVVDRDKNDELVAFGRWHRYPHGYEHLADLELVGLKDRDDPATWPDGFNKEAYLGVLDPLFAARRSWMGEGHYWVLTNIKTREPLQKHGAGSLILKWGLEQATREGVPAYLEAGASATHLYESHGFREFAGKVSGLARMRADPK